MRESAGSGGGIQSRPVATTKLEQLKIGEVSGVDDPAHELPGWMIAKAKKPGDVPDASANSDSPEEAQSIVGKIRNLVFPAGKEEVEMTKEELNETLDARDEALTKSLVEAISEAVKPAPVEKADEVPAVVPETTETPEAPEAAAALTAEDVTKGVEEALQPVLEILDKALDRIAAVENGQTNSARKSLDGQESAGGEAEAETTLPPVQAAISKALNI